ncbi:MAG: phage holin family protein [Actinomycetota bacterium]
MPADESQAKIKISELYDLVIKYAKQEAIDPLRGAGRWLGFGLFAAVLISIGVVIGSLGVLRLVQTTPLGTSNAWSWLCYLITVFICLIVGYLANSRIKRGTLEK